jgi:hypothetical protein
VIRFIDAQHVAGEHAKYPGHPPAYADNIPVGFAYAEGCAVLEHARGYLLRRCHPDATDDWHLDLNNRPSLAQPPELCPGIAEKVFAGVIDLRHQAASLQSAQSVGASSGVQQSLAVSCRFCGLRNASRRSGARKLPQWRRTR